MWRPEVILPSPLRAPTGSETVRPLWPNAIGVALASGTPNVHGADQPPPHSCH